MADQVDPGTGRLAFGLHLHPAFAVARHVPVQRKVQHGRTLAAPVPFHQCPVAFVNAPLGQCPVQRHERLALLGHEQDARGVTVEPMHEFEERGLKPCRAQLLDQAGLDSAATVYRQSGRLVQRDQRVVLQQDRHLAGGERPDRCRRAAAGFDAGIQAHRRHADVVSQSDLVIGVPAPPVDPHLAGADDAVDQALGQAPQASLQKVVEPLSLGLLADRQMPDLQPRPLIGRRGRPRRGGLNFCT